jgi:CMP-N-acetylneuraminic acid synthetase
MKVALITARGGSKGLPRKNVLPLLNTPLIGWTIKAALASKEIDSVFVSTEDSEIAEVSLKFGAKVIPRPTMLAQDSSTSEEVIEHAVEFFEKKKYSVDVLVLLQPTSPLRTVHHIDEALRLYDDKVANCVISVFEPSHTPIKAYLETEDGSITGLYNAGAPYCRRQDLPRAFQPNGAIYAFSFSEFKINNKIPRTKVFPFVMLESDSVDIDTIDDLLNVELTLKSEI